MSSAISASAENFRSITADFAPAAIHAAPAKTLPAAGAASKAGERLLFIDGLRGVAAMFVMMFHLYSPKVSKLYYLLHDIMPSAVDWFLMQGYVGVEIFFVLSGFVIAYTLRNDVCTTSFAANFILRRSIRLDPPYWTLILITIGYKCILWHQYTGLILSSWGVGTILLNMFYVADLTGHLLIVPVAWTLCLEVQFYLALMTMLVISHRVRRWISPRAGTWSMVMIFVPLTVFSLFYRYGEGKLNFFGSWYMFAMGATLAWALSGKIRERWLWVLLTAAACGELWRVDWRAGVAVVTVLVIYACWRLGKMSTWLAWGWIQNLGKISYSLYLCHIAVGTAVIDIMLTYGDKSKFLGVFAFLFAILISIAAANLLHRYVEAPCVLLAKRFKPARPPATLRPKVEFSGGA
jgi:hypothetical protein